MERNGQSKLSFAIILNLGALNKLFHIVFLHKIAVLKPVFLTDHRVRVCLAISVENVQYNK